MGSRSRGNDNLGGDVGGLQIGLEAIAGPAHRFDQLVVPGGRERLAQPPDVHVDRALLDEHVLAPDLVEQPRARENAPRMRHEEVQQAKLGGPEIDRLVARGDLVRRRIDAQAGDLDHVVGKLRRAPAHHRLDAREQLARRERLGDVVVGAALERRDLVLLLGARREQHNGDVLGALVAAQAPREGQPRDARQHPVEQHEIRARLAHQRLGLRHIAGRHYLVPGTLQVGRQQIPDCRFVFDYEYRTTHDVSQQDLVRPAHPRASSTGGISPTPYLTVVSHWPVVADHRHECRYGRCVSDPMRVLVIEDNAELREYLRLALELHEHQALTAENGRQALAYLDGHAVDAVITDVFMPEMDGIETVAALRKKFPDIRVVAMSGRPGVDYLAVARELGVTRTLRKPFEISELLAALKDDR